MDDALINGVQIEQVQGVGAALVAGDGQLVQAGGVLLACQLHRVGHVGLLGPAVGGEPRIRFLVLDAVLKGLVEQAEVVAQAHAVAGQVQRCQRIQEAGSQTAQAAVAQRRFGLHFFNVGQVLACGGQGLAGFVVQTKVDQVVGQQLSDEKLCADIIQFAAGDGLDAVCAFLPDDLQQSQIQLLIRAVCQRFASEVL